MNPLETISTRRMRKVSKKDDMESTNYTNFTQLEDEVDGEGASTAKPRMSLKRDHNHSAAWRPDEDEMCLTTTTIHASTNAPGEVAKSLDSLDREGITMTKNFEWDEASGR
jgi:prephenate dehydratase